MQGWLLLCHSPFNLHNSYVMLVHIEKTLGPIIKTGIAGVSLVLTTLTYRLTSRVADII